MTSRIGRSKLALGLICCLVSGAVLWAESAGGLRWTTPSQWTEARRPMRAANYKVPAAAGDGEDAECGVHYFGAGQGGGGRCECPALDRPVSHARRQAGR